MSDKIKWPGQHRVTCGELFPLSQPADSLIIQIHQEFCVICKAALIAYMSTLEGGE